jgi:non-ribosomal peptide synthetase component F
MRTRLDGDPTFAELLGRVREVALGAYAQQGTPFQMLIEELLPAPDPRYPPLAQVSFALHNAAKEGQPPPDAEAGLRMDVSAVDAGRAAFDLTLRIQETGQGMTCTMEYNTDLFLPATITRMLENYRLLAERVAGDAGRRLSELTAD